MKYTNLEKNKEGKLFENSKFDSKFILGLKLFFHPKRIILHKIK